MTSFAEFFPKLVEGCREMTPEEVEAQAEAERQEQAKLQREILLAKKVPLKDIDRIIAGELEGTEAMHAAKHFSGLKRGILVLSGPRGCGKTTAASWLVSELGGLFMDVSRLARVSRYNDEQMTHLETLPFLVIDDLGMEFSDQKGSFMATLDGLVNARYANLRPTCITTNVNGKTFKDRYGERIADRIRESGSFVELDGKSLRGRK